MGYIKFILNTRFVDDGRTTNAVISRIESDMADTNMLDTSLILHALSARGAIEAVDFTFILNTGILNENILG
ncbi:hypothetical protein [Bacteroides sp. 51]|uniref:hypothetical protein n=1 Tax=Bacteroides sp. 51 TaxID=2302938 RepID=UPI0013CF7B8E|nr:hypothetical protein [Bacteroides sp. 51]NDV83640.1 hypothetical protein [Bacteroides sp. 51]